MKKLLATIILATASMYSTADTWMDGFDGKHRSFVYVFDDNYEYHIDCKTNSTHMENPRGKRVPAKYVTSGRTGDSPLDVVKPRNETSWAMPNLILEKNNPRNSICAITNENGKKRYHCFNEMIEENAFCRF